MNTYVDNSVALTRGAFNKVLEDVNSIRLAIGIGEGKLPELPKGIPGDIQQCVLARALSNGWKAEVEDCIILTSNDPGVIENMDSTKAIKVLAKCGLYAEFETDGIEGEIDVAWFTINLTKEMSTLIQEFDVKFLPSLIAED